MQRNHIRPTQEAATVLPPSERVQHAAQDLPGGEQS